MSCLAPGNYIYQAQNEWASQHIASRSGRCRIMFKPVFIGLHRSVWSGPKV